MEEWKNGLNWIFMFNVIYKWRYTYIINPFVLTNLLDIKTMFLLNLYDLIDMNFDKIGIIKAYSEVMCSNESIRYIGIILNKFVFELNTYIPCFNLILK